MRSLITKQIQLSIAVVAPSGYSNTNQDYYNTIQNFNTQIQTIFTTQRKLSQVIQFNLTQSLLLSILLTNFHKQFKHVGNYSFYAQNSLEKARVKYEQYL